MVLGYATRRKLQCHKKKKRLTTTPVLTNYYPRSHLTVFADASSYSLGAVLLQKTGGHRLPVACASRSLSDIETRYAQIALDPKMEKMTASNASSWQVDSHI